MDWGVSRRSRVAALAFIATFGWAVFWRGYPWHLASVLAMASGAFVYSSLGAISRLQRTVQETRDDNRGDPDE